MAVENLKRTEEIGALKFIASFVCIGILLSAFHTWLTELPWWGSAIIVSLSLALYMTLRLSIVDNLAAQMNNKVDHYINNLNKTTFVLILSYISGWLSIHYFIWLVNP